MATIQTRPTSTSRLGTIVLIVFLSVFVIAGLGACILAITNFVSGEEDPAAYLIPGFMGLLFVGFPLAIYKGIKGSPKGEDEFQRRETAYPGQPWLWQEAWDGGRVASESAVTLWAPWLFAIAFSGFGAVGVGVTIQEVQDEGWAPVGFSAVFLAVGCGMLAWAIYATMRSIKYGASTCVLETFPGVIGGWFNAHVEAKAQPGPRDVVRARLMNIRRYVSGTGKNRSTKEKVLWEDDQAIPLEHIRSEPGGRSMVPVAFRIPSSCDETTFDDPSDRKLWRLELRIESPGVDFKGRYEVPVFVTEDTSEIGFGARDLAPEPEEAEEIRAGSALEISQSPDGRLEIYAPPGRNLKVAILVLFFALLFSGVLVFLIAEDAPIIFPIVFGLFDALLIFFVFSMLFGSVHAHVGTDGVELRTAILGIGKTVRLAPGDIEDVSVEIGMTSGDNAYHKVVFKTAGNRKHTVAGGIDSNKEAQWLAGEILRALGSETH